jgi:uroporphyrinogen decarboxylase
MQDWGTPCFDRVLTALRRQEPDRVPPAEIWVDQEVRDAFMGRPVRSVQDEVDFWRAAGYDFVALDSDVWATPQIQGSITRPLTDTAGIYDQGREHRGWVATESGEVRTWGDVESFPWPRADDLDYSRVKEIGKCLPPGMKTILTFGHIFTAAWHLMGFNHFCLSLYDDPALVAEVLKRLGTEVIRQVERLLSYEHVGALCFQDDIAYTSGMIISLDWLRKLFSPWLVEIAKLCHAYDRPLIYHSDGKMDDYLPEMVAAGVDCFQAVEPKSMDIVAVKREYGGRLALMGNVDLGFTLTRGTAQDVEQAVRHLIKHVAPGGGFLLGSTNSITNYVPLANYRALLASTLKHGRYPISL